MPALFPLGGIMLNRNSRGRLCPDYAEHQADGPTRVGRLAVLLVRDQPAAARACVRRRGMAGQGRGGLVLVYLRLRGAL